MAPGDDILYSETRNGSEDDEDRVFTETQDAVGISTSTPTGPNNEIYEVADPVLLGEETPVNQAYDEYEVTTYDYNYDYDYDYESWENED